MRISQKIVHLTSLISYCCELNINATNNGLDVCLFCVYDFKFVTQISKQAHNKIAYHRHVAMHRL